MNILEKLNLLKEKIETIEKLNEDLIEINLANKTKIQSLEKKIKVLQKGIKDTTNDIEDFIRDLNANN
tara:strand:+ start:73 stop:276 length:204 start_codon:yes stop_codon:yes gene_type:complete